MAAAIRADNKLRQLGAVFALSALVVTSGCAKWSTVYRVNTLPGSDPTAISVDAKQRHVLIVPERSAATDAKGGSVTGWRMCAEAAPDVFSALAASGSGDFGFSQDKSSIGANAKLAFAMNETAGTIERTQTINLLRESFYRTCERYLSGAIPKSAFGVQAGRDMRMAVAVLAIEQLTRVVRPPATIIAPGGTSAATVSPLDWARTLGQAQTDVNDADAALKDAEKRQAKVCDGTEDEKKACEAAKPSKDDVTRLQTLKKQADERYDDLRTMAKNGAVGSTGATTSAGTSIAGGFTTVSAVAASEVAREVRRITEGVLQTDETLLFCLQSLGTPEESGLRPGITSQKASVPVGTTNAMHGTGKDITQVCIDYLSRRVERDTVVLSREMREAAEIKLKSLDTISNELSTLLRPLSPEKFTEAAKMLRSDLDAGFCLGGGDKPLAKNACVTHVAKGDALRGMNIEALNRTWPPAKQKLEAMQ